MKEVNNDIIGWLIREAKQTKLSVKYKNMNKDLGCKINMEHLTYNSKIL